MNRSVRAGLGLLAALLVASGDPVSGTAAPPFGGWLALDGIDDYASAPATPELQLGNAPGESLTVEAWIFYDRFANAGIIEHGDDGAGYNLAMRIEALATPPYYAYCFDFFWYPTGASGAYGISRCQWPAYPAQTWHHLAAIFDGANQRAGLYLDGNRLIEGDSHGDRLRPTLDPFKVGALTTSQGSWRYFPGKIDEVRVSDVARYTTTTYTVPASPFACDGHTRALWHFDEFEGAVAFHDACGADDGMAAHNGAHGEGVPAWRVYQPVVRAYP
jgi:hypothetical protein